MTTTTCRRCNGTGNTGHSYAGGVCRNCGGTGTREAEAPEARGARQFIAWATEEGARRETGSRQAYAAHAARHLKDTAPERFAKAVTMRRTRPDAVYAALVAMADEAAAR